MHVRVDQAGQDGASAQIDRDGGGASDGGDRRPVTDGEDPIAADRDGFSHAARGIHGVDAGVLQDQVGRLGQDGRRQCDTKRENGGGRGPPKSVA